MYSVFVRPFIKIIPAIFFVAVQFSAPNVWSAESLPSQQSRFEGMGSTFKEIKQQSSDSSRSSLIKKEEQQTSDDEINNAESSYFKLHTFVVNVIDNRVRQNLVFLTLEVYCEIKDVNDRWMIDTHIAPIKDTIITHVSGINREQIQTQKQKKELQQHLTEKASAVLTELTGKSIISRLYLTRFLIQ